MVPDSVENGAAVLLDVQDFKAGVAFSWMHESLKLVWLEKCGDFVSISLQLRFMPREVAGV